MMLICESRLISQPITCRFPIVPTAAEPTADKDDEAKKLKPIVGHVSMVTDMVLSADDKYVITADRDEHIRVSRFPNGYNIESFCLGHTE
jgi:WD40 repeat protein